LAGKNEAKSGAGADRDRIVEIDKKLVWHPYTEMSRYRDEVDPLVVVRAEGARLYDADGSVYLDGNSSWWTASLGHNHPRLVGALKRQADILCHTALAGITHETATALAEKLVEVAPGDLPHVFYSDDGSTCVEVGMKLALQYWYQNGRPNRRAFVSLEDGFHGETLGVTAIGGVDVFRKPFESSLLESIHVPSPARRGGEERALDALQKAIEGNVDMLAGIVVEPIVQGASGMQIYSPDYLRAARDLCDRFDLFLICDEVFSGYGRTGKMWAIDHAEVVPDILCTAKGFTAGMLPMAATLTTDRIFEGFLGDPGRAFHYGHTFSGNPLGAAVALEVLRVYEDEKVIEGIAERERKIHDAFAALAERPGVGAYRNIGMIGALDLEGDDGYLSRAGWEVYEAARKRGAYLRPLGNVVYVCPPLNIPLDDLDELLSIVAGSVEEVLAGR